MPESKSNFVISQIVAMAENRVIGRNGGMPWHIPEDFKYFKSKTMGHVIIMGRKTWTSIGRCLPGRLTIIVSRSKDFQAPPDAMVMTSIVDATEYARKHQDRWGHECFIVGGGEIYQQAMPLTDRIYLTKVHETVDGDTYFPDLPKNEFHEVSTDLHDHQKPAFTFSVWERHTK